MPNDTNTPAGRRLDATCPACAGAVTDVRERVENARERAGQAQRLLDGLVHADGAAERYRVACVRSALSDVDDVATFALDLLDRAALASARPRDDLDAENAMYAAGLRGVDICIESLYDAHAEGDTKTVSRLFAALRGKHPGWDEDADLYRAAVERAQTCDDAKAPLAAPAPAPAPHPVRPHTPGFAGQPAEPLPVTRALPRGDHD